MRNFAISILAVGFVSQAACGGNQSSGTSTSSAGGAGGHAGTGGSASASGMGGMGGAPSCTLTDSGPIVTTQDGQVIENVHIVSTAGAAITVQGHKKVVIRNARIEHAGGPGIDIAAGADDVLIEGV